MQASISFALDGPTGNLQVMRTGLLIAELTPDDQLQLLMAVAQAHLTRNDHVRVNGAPPRPVLESITNPVG